MSVTRRFYLYAVSLVTLSVASWGAGLLLSLVFDSLLNTQPLIARNRDYSSQQLALGLSMLVIAGMVWLLHWRAAQRASAADERERGSALRKLYLSLLQTVSAIVALMTGLGVVRWWLGGLSTGEAATGQLAAFMVSLAVWSYNWREDSKDPPPSPSGKTLQRWHRYIVSAWALVVVVLGVVNLLGMLLDRSIFSSESFVRGPLWSVQFRQYVARIVAGSPLWAFYWLFAGLRDSGSLRQVYLYLFAITGGSVAALASLSMIMFRLLQWLLGAAPGGKPVSGTVVWAIPLLLMGAAVWAYHWQTAKEEAAEAPGRRSSARRIYYYLLSGIGLGGTAFGGAFLIGLIVNLALNWIDPSNLIFESTGWWKDQLATFIVLLGVGVTVWGIFWSRAQGEARRNGGERSARSRKVYLYTFLCLSIVALVAGTINVVYRVLTALLQGTTAFETLDQMRWGLQAVFMAIPTLAYHFALLREDIQAGAEKAAGPAAKRGRESVYLDYNATTPLDPRVVDAMVPFLYKSFGNPSSGHVYGQEARAAVDTARQQVSDLFGCSPDEVIFTSGGSESNNTAIKGLALSPGRVGHIITSAIEHPSVAKPIDHLRQWGFRVTAVPVDPAGRVNPTDIASAISPDTVLISIMHANNETGTIEPVEEIGMIARSRGIPFHTDAAQTAGKISIDASTLRADLITIAGHKLYAPKGVGALYVRSGLRLEPLIHGAGHEHERRAGTENVPGIVGLGKACEIARLQLKEDAGRVRALRDQLHHRLLQATDRIVLNGHPDLRLQNTLNVSFLGWNGSDLLADLGDIAASTGSACHDRRLAISPVLLAMGATTEQGAGSVRFSLGRFSTQDDIDRVIERLTEALQRGPRPQAAC